MLVETGWCTTFSRRPGRWFAPSKLESAYRAPSLFAQQMLRSGSCQHELGCDEGFGPATKAGTTIAYLCTHGQQVGDDFRFSGRVDDHDVDGLRCAIVVVDTCDLVVVGPPRHLAVRLDQGVRLLLGFDGRATNDSGSSQRGHVFADLILAGHPVGDAWVAAVLQTAYYGSSGPYDKPVVIGVGDSATEAEAMCRHADLGTIEGLGPRLGPATIAVRR